MTVDIEPEIDRDVAVDRYAAKRAANAAAVRRMIDAGDSPAIKTFMMNFAAGLVAVFVQLAGYIIAWNVIFDATGALGVTCASVIGIAAMFATLIIEKRIKTRFGSVAGEAASLLIIAATCVAAWNYYAVAAFAGSYAIWIATERSTKSLLRPYAN